MFFKCRNRSHRSPLRAFAPAANPFISKNKKDEASEGFVLGKFSSFRDETDWFVG
jgi:hypothetical protein